MSVCIYKWSPCHLIHTSNLYLINELVFLNAEFLPSTLLLYKTLTTRDQFSHPLKRASHIVLIGAASSNKRPTVVGYVCRR
jgi:hypothetical protein